MDFLTELKRVIARRDDYRCRRCGIELKQKAFERNIDHIIPRDLIAISEFWNLELLCIDCNEEKGSDLPSDFQERCIRAFFKSFNQKEGFIEEGTWKAGLREKEVWNIALRTIFRKHANYYQNELKKHYQDDYINRQKYGNNYRILVDLVRNLALKRKFKVSKVKKKKKSTEKLSQQLKKEANEAIKSLKNIFKPKEEKKEEKAIKAEQDLLLQYDRKFSSFLLSFAQNKHYSTVIKFWARYGNLTPRKDNEIPSANEILYNYLRMFEYLNNC